MSDTFNSAVEEVLHGEDDSHQANDNIVIWDEEIRWKGITVTHTHSNQVVYDNDSSSTVSGTGTVSTSTSIPTSNNGDFSNLYASGGTSYGPSDGDASLSWSTPWTSSSGSYTDGGEVDFGSTNYNESNEGGTVKTTIDVSDYGGSSFSIYAHAEHHRTTYYDEDHPTIDPRVSGDWNAQYNGSISDGTWCAWQNLDGVTEGSNSFTHGIDGSEKAKYEFRYKYKPETPVAEEIFKVTISGTVYNVALADPADPSLIYDNVRVEVNGKTLCMDVVDPSNVDSIHAYIQTPQGKLALRENSTTT